VNVLTSYPVFIRHSVGVGGSLISVDISVYLHGVTTHHLLWCPDGGLWEAHVRKAGDLLSPGSVLGHVLAPSAFLETSRRRVRMIRNVIIIY